MSPNSSKRDPASGFTLIEVTVSLLLLVIVLTLSMSLLFAMKSFSQRQQQFAEPRQVARRALDYISSKIRQASDFNSAANNPNAIPAWYVQNGVTRQCCYNNFNNAPAAGLADVGTDVLCVAVPPTNAAFIPISTWNGTNLNADGVDVYINYVEGCPTPVGPLAGGDDATNMSLFKAATGHDPATGLSQVLTLADDSGNWTYYQITSYVSSSCATTNKDATTSLPQIIKVTCAPTGPPSGITPPSKAGDIVNPPLHILGNVGYETFRVLGGQLQQKTGFMNPNTDAPGADFTALLDNVEDMQVAWIFNDGTVGNDGTNELGTTGGIPEQTSVDVGVKPPPDVASVVGIRLSITAVASTPVANQIFSHYFRPASEDRAAGANDKFYHHRLTATIMIRNRMLGG